MEIGNETQLFVDDLILEETEGIRQVLNPAVKHPQNPLLVPDRPWETQYALPRTVLNDSADHLFKMWYSCDDQECYAVSRDGIDWHWAR